MRVPKEELERLKSPQAKGELTRPINLIYPLEVSNSDTAESKVVLKRETKPGVTPP